MITSLVLLATLGDVTGSVYRDENANGRRDVGERGLANVVVSDQVSVTVTDQTGAYRFADSKGFGVVFVSVPDGFRSSGTFWMPVGEGAHDFGLAPIPRRSSFTFVHASDTHISDATVARTRRLRHVVDSIAPAFVVITGDLVRDALRVGEREARGYYELFGKETDAFRSPVWTVPGNHEIFGVERGKSGIAVTHPLYGRAMYRHYRGPDYYSFTAGGVHFVGLNTIDVADTAYYGHVDETQLEWLRQDLAQVPAGTPVVTFNHIPFFTAVETIGGLKTDPPAPSVITVNGTSSFRHVVSNAAEVIRRVSGHPYPLALGGHMHVREQLRYPGVATRFDQSGATVAPTENAGLTFPSGVTVYRVRLGQIAEGVFVPLDGPLKR